MQNEKHNDQEKKRKQYNEGRRFCKKWMYEFWWAQSTTEGKVLCMVCSYIEKQHKTLDKKYDTLQKHAGEIYEKVTKDGKIVDNIIWAAKNRHKENEEKYLSRVYKPDAKK